MSFARRLAVVAPVAVSIVALDACGGGGGGRTALPSAPSAQIVQVVPTPLLNDPNAIPIELNQAETGTIGISGPWCNLWDPLDTYGFPCQTYRLNLPAAGTVRVHITWSEANQRFCSAVGRGVTSMTCKNTSPVDASYVVPTGSAFAFAVNYEGGAASQTVPPDFKLNYSVTVTLGAAVSGRAR
jgi:hypothetical protein